MSNLDVAQARAASLDLRVKRHAAAVRSAFIASSNPETPPPMTQLMRGGRGGGVKLKLLLSMLWIATKEPYDVVQPARVWAELIGLDDPGTKGAARVNAAIRRLVADGYLESDKSPGMPSRLYLLEETGSRRKYTHPGSYWGATSSTNKKTAPKYTQLPKELWLNAWIAQLSAPALAMLLVLLEQARGKNYSGIWFSPAVASGRYGLTEVTRRKGLAELRELRVISVGRAPVSKNQLGTIRYRNTYDLDTERLSESPTAAKQPRSSKGPKKSGQKSDLNRSLQELLATQKLSRQSASNS